jgi:hypothetical protein
LGVVAFATGALFVELQPAIRRLSESEAVVRACGNFMISGKRFMGDMFK